MSPQRPQPDERLLERMARAIVAEHLDTRVARLDDGSEPSMPDGLIVLADGSTAPLEVVADHDDRWNELTAALKRHGSTLNLAPSSPAWFVALRHNANLKRARERLPALLHTLPAGALVDGACPADTWSAGREHARTLETLSRLGVTHVQSRPGEHGQVSIGTHGWDSWHDPVTLLPWIDRVFIENADVPQKLLRAGGAEQHAFIWATIGSPYLVTRMLREADEPDEDDADRGPYPELLEQLFAPTDRDTTPLADPTLPDGVTHLWVASTRSGRRALHWSPTGGWVSTRWRTPARLSLVEARIRGLLER